MTWLVFTYSLPATKRSSPRVAIWRKLVRAGAISPRAGVHILPGREECLESFQWLGKEVQQNGGESLLMRVESLSPLAKLRRLTCMIVRKKYHLTIPFANVGAAEQSSNARTPRSFSLLALEQRRCLLFLLASQHLFVSYFTGRALSFVRGVRIDFARGAHVLVIESIADH